MAYPYDSTMPGGLLGTIAGYPQQTPKATSMGGVITQNPGFLAGVTALSMLANNNGRRSFGQLLGRGGLDALGALGNAGAFGLQRDRLAEQDALTRAQFEGARADRDLQNTIALGNYQLARQKAQREQQEADTFYHLMGMGGPSPLAAPGLLGGGQPGAAPQSAPMGGDTGGVSLSAGVLPPKNQRPAGPDGAPLDKAALTNNPGNIGNFGDHVKVFPTTLDGLKGMVQLLRSPTYAKNPTVAGIISTWSPPNENDTNALIRQTSAMLGVAPDQRLDLNDPNTMRKLTEAITINEGSRKYIPDGEFDMAVGLSPVPKDYKSRDYRTGGGMAQDGTQQMPAAPQMPSMGGMGGSIPPQLYQLAMMPGPYGKWANSMLNSLFQRQMDINKQSMDLMHLQMERDAAARDQAKMDPGYAYRQGLAASAVKWRESLEDDINTRRDAIQNADRVESLYGDGLKTGIGQEIIDTANRFLHSLGYQGDLWGAANKPETAEAFRQNTMQNVFTTLLQQKGVQTEGDADRARQLYAMYGNTPEGNKLIIQYSRNIAKRGIERDRFLIRYLDEHNGDRSGAEDAWDAHMRTLPSVVPEPSGKAPASTSQSSASQPSGGRTISYDKAGARSGPKVYKYDPQGGRLTE